MVGDEIPDLKALAERLESVEKFAEEFAQKPQLAYAHPIILHFCAIKL